ncbi:ComF family protein [Streptococcus caprae]
MRDYFKHYKFLGDYLLREVFAGELRQALKAYKDYTIVPVPVSSETLLDRGFNQVTGLLEGAGIFYQDCLSKEEAAKQSHLTRQERLALKNHYSLATEQALPERVLLVDDVYTTGATIVSIALLFHEKGVKDVKTFSLAR